jgi:hypothetical protein
MDLPTIAPAGQAGWLELAERTAAAQKLAADDPLMALAQMTQVEEDAEALLAHEMEYLVRQARESGKTWAEIAAATGVKDRQAAWRRWTDRGIR